MKFAHLADIHIGGWQDQKLRKLNLNAFDKAINICINENTAFILIAGDFFNTALPSIDSLKDVARILRKVKEKNKDVWKPIATKIISLNLMKPMSFLKLPPLEM